MQRYRLEHPDVVKATARRTYEKNKERRLADVAAWQAANPDKVFEAKRRYHVRYRFGLEWDEYLALIALRGDTCWICGTPDNWQRKGGGKRLEYMSVDHDHDTGRVRGLLCTNCNEGISRFDEDPARLESAAAYLRETA